MHHVLQLDQPAQFATATMVFLKALEESQFNEWLTQPLTRWLKTAAARLCEA